MANILENLRDLKRDMEEKGWNIDSFLFHYRNIEYIVLVKLYLVSEKKPQYALVKLEFIKSDDMNNRLLIPTNTNGFMTDIVSITEIRNFFGVEYQENLGVFIQQFYRYLAHFIPVKVLDDKSDIEKKAMVISLSISDSENPNKKYCKSVMRNPIVNGKQKTRSIFNDNKTRILRLDLYQEFADDETISFCYSEDRTEEKSKSEIMRNFAKNNK